MSSLCSEIEFTLRFGCDVPTHIDQGVRFEIDPGNRTWFPIRFYTPTLTPELNMTNPRVQLEPGGNSVLAEAASYNSSLPLVHLNDSVGVAGGVVIREYLCQDYVNLIRNGERFRLRWMQRYLSNPRADVATWSLDNIRIRVWNGSCFQTLLSEDFDSPNMILPQGISVLVMRGSVVNPPCSTDSVAYFNGEFDPPKDIRRSLLMTLDGYSLGSCSNPPATCTDSGKSMLINLL